MIFDLWKLRRKVEKDLRVLHDSFKLDLRKAEEENDHDKEQSILAEKYYERENTLSPLRSMETEHHSSRARRYGIHVPRKPSIFSTTDIEKMDDGEADGTAYWAYSTQTGDVFLTEAAIHNIERAVRKEQAERREPWYRLANTAIALLGLLVGMMGAAAALWVVWQSR